MAFLDNSGDIIMDAVLTDTGRMRMAKGDGSFRIVKFALSDDEIDYSLYDKDHASGSAYYDLTILQTPILESFTDNAASMKSKLVSNPRNNLLYLPILKLNEVFDLGAPSMHSSGHFLVAVDTDSQTALTQDTSGNPIAGILFGVDLASAGGGYIRVDQGLDTNALSPSTPIGPMMNESQYIVEIDNRFGQICSRDGDLQSYSFVDDDNIAYYNLAWGTSDVVSKITSTTADNQVIAGPRGTKSVFKIQAALELNTSNYYFTTLGSTITLADADNAATSYFAIDSTVRITGATTGYRIDVPVRFVKRV